MCSPNWNDIDCGTKDDPKFITSYECSGGDPVLISKLSKEFGKTEDELAATFKRHAHTSFFSGHASLIWSSAIFVYLYLKVRILSHTPKTMIMIAAKLIQVMSVGIAIWVSYTRITDFWHHPSDVLAGSLVGISGQYFNVMYLMDLHIE